MSLIRRTLAVGAATAAVAVPLAVAGSAQAATTAMVSVVHGIPGVTVDVYVDGTKVLPNFTFKTVAGPLSLPAGSHDVAVRKAGDPASATPILSAKETLTAGENATIVANLDASAKPTLNAFANPTSALPAGQSRLVVRHVAAAPAVDVRANGTVVISGLTNPNEKALTVPAGTVSADVVLAGQSTPVIGPVSLTLAAGSTTIVYAVGNPADSTLTAVTQTYTGAAMGSGTPGGVPTGSGGQASASPSSVPFALAGLAGLVLAAVGGRRLLAARR